VNAPGVAAPAEFGPRSWRNRGRLTAADHVRLAAPDPWTILDPALAAAWEPQVLDIGFGHGESLVAVVGQCPDSRVLGIEVHAPGVLRACDRLAAVGADAASVRVLRRDVTVLLPLLPAQSLRHVQAFHPDPWPKRRHADRRLFGAEVLARLAELLAPGATLHLVTDDDTYAAGIRTAAAQIAALTPGPDDVAVPDTKYGRRARAAGREVHSLTWSR
jgi:tRNA (guanine-N7-)-methyltransferase